MSAFWLFQRDAPRRRTWRSFALAAWLLALALSLTRPQRHLPDQIEEWRAMLATGSKNVQSYLATGDSSFILRAPGAEVPSFFPKRLRELLDTPEIRSSLPPTLLSVEAPRPWVEAFKSGFLRLGGIWIAIGTFLLAAVAVRSARGVAKPETRLAVGAAPETVDLHNA